MCGICCRLRRIGHSTEISPIEIDDLTKVLLTNRGPNANSELTLQTDNFNIHFSGFVLWQQGAKLCVQPYSYKHHTVLINGDIFTKRNDNSLSDTEWLIRRIDKCNDDETDLLELFRSLEGPYSVIYYNQNTSKLYFVRDILGRQSLLLAKSPTGDTVLSSVLGASRRLHSTCIELPPLGVFCMNLQTEEIQLNPWQTLSDTQMKQLTELQNILEREIKVKSPIDSCWLIKEDSLHSFNFESILRDYIKTPSADIFARLQENDKVSNVCDEVIIRLENSLQDRISATPSVCRECLAVASTKCDHARIGILFSGGIDCTILAVLTDKLLDPSQPIDLINVSFQKINRSKSNLPIDYKTPDRVSAYQSLEELKQLNPHRKWNLVEVDVTREELENALQNRICHLVYPLNTVLDESLGSVLWFGARGQGKVDDVEYTSKCRVLLIGSGADELFGGYTRHRNAFIRQYEDGLTPFERLENELEFDFNRLPNRNLARDDRVIGDHGVTARSPYLEEELVHFVRSLKPYQKCYPALEQGVGEKLLLRLCGFRLGLREATVLKKRAMQFGSRVADSKQNAKDISESLTHILNS